MTDTTSVVPDTAAIDRLTDAAMAFADASRPVVLETFRRPHSIDRKADRSLVTEADRAAEDLLRDRIAATFPGHGVIGEEMADIDTDRDYVWIVDPIDGTHAFIAGLPTFGTLVAVCYRGEPVVGIIDMPAMGERWIGAHGRPTRHVDRAGTVTDVATRNRSALRDATVYATTPAMFTERQRRAFDAVAATAAIVRYGMDCYGYAMVASGFGDLVIEADMKVYDYLPLIPVLRGAGGVIGDWSGHLPILGANATSATGTIVAAGSQQLFDQTIAELGRHMTGVGPE